MPEYIGGDVSRQVAELGNLGPHLLKTREVSVPPRGREHPTTETDAHLTQDIAGSVRQGSQGSSRLCVRQPCRTFVEVDFLPTQFQSFVSPPARKCEEAGRSNSGWPDTNGV